MNANLFILLSAAAKFDLARQWRWWRRHWPEYFDPTIMSLVGLACLLAVVIWILRRQQRRELKQIDNPVLLYQELCRAHRLSWRQRSLLRQVAQQRQIANQLELFVEPSHLVSVANSTPNPKKKTRLQQLQTKLFGE